MPEHRGVATAQRKISTVNEALRRRRAAHAVSAAGHNGLLVTHPADVRYLSGFTGSNGAVALAGNRAVLFTDSRYTTQARQEAAGLRISISKSATDAATAWLVKSGVTRCAFDPAHTSVSALGHMRKALPPKLPATTRRGFFQSAENLVARLREVKDADELARMRRAAELGCALFQVALEVIEPGVPELEVAAAMELIARKEGADGMSFETIVASGKRSALPHGRATAATLPARGFVTLDFGVLLDGYCSDMTRTVHIGKAAAEARSVYHSVLAAQVAAVAAVMPGATCGKVDEAARSVLRSARISGKSLAKFFTHSTGHGVGLEIHEGPRVAAKQEQTLAPGMVITVEPGVYLPGKFGVRIEDMVAVTATGGEVLTAASPKELIEI
jgi:Xaa-Pro aminopeptidase